MNNRTNPTVPAAVFFLLLSLLSASCNLQNQAKDESRQAAARTTGTYAPAGNPASRPVGNIRSMLHDGKGTYWFGSDGEGLYRYDGKTVALFTVRDGLCDNRVSAIREDRAGNIWIRTGKGICRYDGTCFGKMEDSEARPGRTVYSPEVWHKEPGNLWFPADAGVYRYDGISFYNYRFPGSEIEAALSSLPYDPYDVYCTFEDRAGNLWFGTQSRGVCRFDGLRFTWFGDKGLEDAAVRAIFQDKAGNLWFGNNGYGLFRYDGKTLTNFTEEKGLGNPEFIKSFKEKEGTLARVWTIDEDTDGNLWIGTIDAGAWRYDGKTLTNYTVKDGLTDNGVTVIYKDQKGELWFGTAGEMCRFNGKSFTKFGVGL